MKVGGSNEGVGRVDNKSLLGNPEKKVLQSKFMFFPEMTSGLCVGLEIWNIG